MVSKPKKSKSSSPSTGAIKSKSGIDTKMNNIATNEDWWSIPQVLAWIVVRDHKIVRGVNSSITPFDILVYFLEAQSTFEEIPKSMLPALDARKEFCTKCESGELSVWAARSQNGAMEIVSAADWFTIDNLKGNNPEFPHDALGGLYQEAPRYFRAVVSSADAIAVWPQYKSNRTPVFEIKQIIEGAIRKKGGRLTVKEVDDLEVKYRTENSTPPQREKFRKALISLFGAGERGRKPKNKIP